MMNFSPTETSPDPSFWSVTSWLQLGYGFWVNLTVVGIGLAFGFPAVTVPQLLDTESPIQITQSELAWIASVLTLITPLGCLVSGFLQDKYGRRHMLILSQLPASVGWIYTGHSSSAINIIFGRVVTGFAVGLAMPPPRTYITEITLPNMRGVVGAFPGFGIGLGIAIQAALGSVVKWSTLSYICGVYSIILSCSYIMIPESPYYVLMKTSSDNAEKVLRKFRSRNFDIQSEIEEMADYKEAYNIRRLNNKETIKAMFKPSACKPFCIGMCYFTLMQAVGVNVLTMWGVEILQTSKLSINPYLGNFGLAATRVVVGIVTSILLFKVKRRILALLSAIGVGLVCLALGIWLYLYGKRSIYPQIFLTAYMTFATLGYYTLPALYMYELLPLQVRGVLGGFGLAYVNLLMFAATMSYPYLKDAIGLAPVILIYGIISLLDVICTLFHCMTIRHAFRVMYSSLARLRYLRAILLYFILPETKGVTLQEIEEYFNSVRPTLVSSRLYKKAQVPKQKEKRTSHETKKEILKLQLSRTKIAVLSEQPGIHFKDDLPKKGSKKNENE